MSFKAVFFIVTGSIAFLILLFLVGGMMMPRTAQVSRSVEIDVPVSFLFPYVNVSRNFIKWSPWKRYDTKVFYSYEGPRQGKGASVYWASDHDKVGTGSHTILKSEENEAITTRLSFGATRSAETKFNFSTPNGKTTLTWSFEADFGHDYSKRYSGPFLFQFIDKEFEVGLNRLREIAEKDYALKQEADRQTVPAQEGSPTQLIAPAN